MCVFVFVSVFMLPPLPPPFVLEPLLRPCCLPKVLSNYHDVCCCYDVPQSDHKQCWVLRSLFVYYPSEVRGGVEGIVRPSLDLTINNEVREIMSQHMEQGEWGLCPGNGHVVIIPTSHRARGRRSDHTTGM